LLHLFGELPGGWLFAALVHGDSEAILGQHSEYPFASAAMICSDDLPVDRGSGLISSSSIFASRGMRLAYSL